MSLLNKLKDTTYSKFKGAKPTGPNSTSTQHVGDGFSEGTYQDYLVSVAGKTAESSDDSSFVVRSTVK